jgi:two-component system, response regulator
MRNAGDTMAEKTMLLVEDNADDVELTLRAFEANRGHSEMVVLRDGAQALDYLFAKGAYAGRDAGLLPAIMLLDLKLPKVDGLEVLERIRSDARTRLLPVVILTSSREQRDLIRSYDLGANAYVRKPVDFAQFTEAMRQISLFWLLINEPPPALGSTSA